MSYLMAKVAIYKTKWDSHAYVEEKYRRAYDEDADYVRLTEFADIVFPELPAKDVLDAQLAQIDKGESEARAKFQMVLDEFSRRRQELLALPHLESSE